MIFNPNRVGSRLAGARPLVDPHRSYSFAALTVRIDGPRVRALGHLGRAVDEPHDVVVPLLVAIGGVDLYPGCLHRDPVEGVVRSREVRQVMIGAGAVRPAHRIILAALHNPGEGHLVANHAVHDTQLHNTAKWLQARPRAGQSHLNDRGNRGPAGCSSQQGCKLPGLPHGQCSVSRGGGSAGL